MVGENIEIYMFQLAKTDHELSIMVGENIEIYMSQLAKNHLKLSTIVGEIFKFTCLKWLKIILNCPHWLDSLEKKLKFVCLKWLKVVLNCPSWLENITGYANAVRNLWVFEGALRQVYTRGPTFFYT